jgi:vacuolar-type H+-ATPase subunit H
VKVKSMTEHAAGTEAREALDRIKQAEAEARNAVRDAREKAGPGILQEAHEEAKKNREKKISAAREKAAKTKDALVAEAKNEADEIRKKTDSDKAAILDKGRKSVDKAAQAVREKLEEIL